MNNSFSLVDSLALSDLQVYVSRAGRVEEGSVRLIAASRVLAVYTAIFYPQGLLDDSATVLGLRTWALTEDAEFDVVVPVLSLLDRLTRLTSSVHSENAPVVVKVPHEVSTVTWTGISPPRGSWSAIDSISAAVMEETARAGIAEVAAAVPAGIGEQIVQRVRREVWGRPIENVEHLPASAAFAAYSLGFLSSNEEVTAFETGPWTRLTTTRGHILVRRKPWTLRP